MEERAAGGERLLRPCEWAQIGLSWRTLSKEYQDRVDRCPDRPMTRFEYLEELAFAKEKES